MFAAVGTKIASQGRVALSQSSRQMSVVSGPPTVKISPIEKLVHGLAIATGITIIPGWVLVNIKHYRARD